MLKSVYQASGSHQGQGLAFCANETQPADYRMSYQHPNSNPTAQFDTCLRHERVCVTKNKQNWTPRLNAPLSSSRNTLAMIDPLRAWRMR